jgi:hypothetical protein
VDEAEGEVKTDFSAAWPTDLKSLPLDPNAEPDIGQ